MQISQAPQPPAGTLPPETRQAAAAPRQAAGQRAPGELRLPLAGRASAVHNGSATLGAVQSLGYIIVVAIFIVTFSLQPFRIPSASMEPTLLIGDFLLVNKQEPASSRWLSPLPDNTVHRGDVIVFRYPVDPSLHLVKRVIGLPGDRLRMRGGRVFINGALLPEPYAVYSRSRADIFRDDFPHLGSTDPDLDAHWWIEMHHLVLDGDLKIPSGSYFVLGDNRNDSEDSRYWGLVPAASIVGEPFLVYFSLRNPPDPAERPRDGSAPVPLRPTQPRSLAEAILDAARWDRTLHVIH